MNRTYIAASGNDHSTIFTNEHKTTFALYVNPKIPSAKIDAAKWTVELRDRLTCERELPRFVHFTEVVADPLDSTKLFVSYPGRFDARAESFIEAILSEIENDILILLNENSRRDRILGLIGQEE